MAKTTGKLIKGPRTRSGTPNHHESKRNRKTRKRTEATKWSRRLALHEGTWELRDKSNPVLWSNRSLGHRQPIWPKKITKRWYLLYVWNFKSSQIRKICSQMPSFPFHFRGLGVEVCSLDVALVFATVCNLVAMVVRDASLPTVLENYAFWSSFLRLLHYNSRFTCVIYFILCAFCVTRAILSRCSHVSARLMSRGKRSTWDVCLVIFVASADALEDWCWRAFAARIGLCPWRIERCCKQWNVCGFLVSSRIFFGEAIQDASGFPSGVVVSCAVQDLPELVWQVWLIMTFYPVPTI